MTDQTFYLSARRKWESRHGDALDQARNWRVIAIVAAITAAASIATAFVAVNRQKAPPFITAIDQVGQAINMANLQGAKVPAIVIETALRSWVTDLRTVHRETVAQKTALRHVYSLMAAQAVAGIEPYLKGESGPFNVMKERSVSVDINTYLPMSENSAQVLWTETARDLPGNILFVKRYRADITFAMTPPATQEDAMKNPLGIAVTGIHWSEIK